MVVVVRGGRRRTPVMTGLMVGGAVSRNRQRRQHDAAMQQQVAQANAKAEEAQREAAAAKAEAEKQAAVAEARAQSQPAQPTGMIPVQVSVPAGVGPGATFNVQHGGQVFAVVCPAGVGPGQTIMINVPAPQPTVAVAVAANPNSAMVAAPQPMMKKQSSGKEIFRNAMLETPQAGASKSLVLVAPHMVDENSPQMKQFGIISIPNGTFVNLVEGDLLNGLGGGFKDYVRVEVPSQGGRVGLISRLVVKPVSEVGPPPAIMAASAPPAPPPAIGL
mmetsp:Transcript_17713/g.28665  ORF Transcript_17713/g.28665 Transcript_17713/m.28665 type:complete len:275 (+) Transcript_17713:151-975(+)|eukprot:CAMPEP_0203768246 /NCGR_PEP_ID=MMETSP0099_2-20121227/1472_1 /ASSEMBLY_ACC=CAM_ASM_000209 /TAXON_ID=96639 /ORGANISM=" , Strain NY0313808BC1" /LENGTH=274 /DNA_ID=CAMNT_0050664897 /DNA_START=151 /DNA_END=975 /DNA_ORIENTATION=-